MLIYKVTGKNIIKDMSKKPPQLYFEPKALEQELEAFLDKFAVRGEIKVKYSCVADDTPMNVEIKSLMSRYGLTDLEARSEVG